MSLPRRWRKLVDEPDRRIKNEIEHGMRIGANVEMAARYINKVGIRWRATLLKGHSEPNLNWIMKII